MMITKNEYDELLKYMGNGDLESAELIIFGNEEGTGGYDIKENIYARCERFGYGIRHKEQEIYWQKNAIEGRKILHECSKKEQFKTKTEGAFLEYISRIACAINNRGDDDIENWFKTKSNIGIRSIYNERINRYMQEQLLSGHEEGIKIGLIDWRPLPRPNQSVWPKEYNTIDKKEYLAAFNFTRKKKYENKFSNYKEDVEIRKKYIKKCIIQSNVKTIVGFGEVIIKEKLLKNIFSDACFKDMELNKRAKYANINVYGRNINIYLIPFPSCGKGGFKNGIERMEFFTAFVSKYLLPSLENK